MNLKKWALPVIASLILSLSPLQAEPVPLQGDLGIPNIGIAKKLFKEYYQSGRYFDDIRTITLEAQKYIDDCVVRMPKDKLAMILDIDETSLSNAPHILQFDYGFLPAEWDKWVLTGKAPPLDGTLELYKHAQSKGVSIFFITGRHESERAATVKNLEEVGFHKWAALILKPDNTTVTSKDFKTYHRKQITESGYHIIVNVGDQMSDLEGGYSDAVYKLPNPMYYVP